MNEKLTDIIFYTLEKSIKTYRQFAQKRIAEKGYNVTIDQWLVLKILHDNEGITQQQLAEIVFKDYASVTRIIELLVNKKYIQRDFHSRDRRRFALTLSAEGKKLLTKIRHDIDENRSKALKGISKSETEAARRTLNKIISNCTNNNK
ncbi:MAG TPA: MarR family transcriptional regulator [Parafilimonas sp.]|nr:MarR family transcriptional regulator [Parafilimonas sp.]